MSDTPETDQWTGLRHDVRQLVETSRRLERERNHNRRLYETENKDLQGLLKNFRRVIAERDELKSAIRNLRDVKGRHNTEIAARRLFALLSDSTPSKPTKP